MEFKKINKTKEAKCCKLLQHKPMNENARKIEYNKKESETFAVFQSTLRSIFASSFFAILFMLALTVCGVLINIYTNLLVLGIAIIIICVIILIPLILSGLYSFKLFLFSFNKNYKVVRTNVVKVNMPEKDNGVFEIYVDTGKPIMYFNVNQKSSLPLGTEVDVITDKNAKPIFAIPPIIIFDIDSVRLDIEDSDNIGVDGNE